MSEAHEKADLYALDLSEATWKSAPGSDPGDRIEIAELPGGAVALRNPADPDGTVLRYTAGEWEAFVLGARDGEFDGE
ncbi:DUF397 domain-containing protein [Streptomyces iconiensis]|uniref:DUF397 domain-containing protein n=1 Tax=Streptomyces iconiensis TaxID=1384038 RepID=A0ABT6ZNI5_9ACTN|nr:DUF397 domain-containing protein [Streptomyces iconiensis]MDJ1130437.1 DUF397 domain-containing protein [Streptomyces iconiensis]